MKQVKHIVHCLEQEIRSLKHKNKDLESNGQSQDRVVEKVTKQLKTKHQVYKMRLCPVYPLLIIAMGTILFREAVLLIGGPPIIRAKPCMRNGRKEREIICILYRRK